MVSQKSITARLVDVHIGHVLGMVQLVVSAMVNSYIHHEAKLSPHSYLVHCIWKLAWSWEFTGLIHSQILPRLFNLNPSLSHSIFLSMPRRRGISRRGGNTRSRGDSSRPAP